MLALAFVAAAAPFTLANAVGRNKAVDAEPYHGGLSAHAPAWPAQVSQAAPVQHPVSQSTRQQQHPPASHTNDAGQSLSTSALKHMLTNAAQASEAKLEAERLRTAPDVRVRAGPHFFKNSEDVNDLAQRVSLARQVVSAMGDDAPDSVRRLAAGTTYHHTLQRQFAARQSVRDSDIELPPPKVTRNPSLLHRHVLRPEMGGCTHTYDGVPDIKSAAAVSAYEATGGLGLGGNPLATPARYTRSMNDGW